MTSPKPESIEAILELTQEQHQDGDAFVTEFVMRTKECIFQDNCDVNGINHRTCYEDFFNKTKRDCVKESMKKS